MLTQLLGDKLWTVATDIINYSLKLDPALCQKLNQFEGKRLRVNCIQPQLDIEILILTDQVSVRPATESEQPWDVIVSGNLGNFVQSLRQNIEGAQAMASGIRVEGDTGLLQSLTALTADLEIDWEQPLVDNFGPMTGHLIAQALRVKFAWFNQAKQRMPAVLKNYFQEESSLVPHPIAVEQFYRDIRQTQLGVDRLQAKLTRLESQFEK